MEKLLEWLCTATETAAIKNRVLAITNNFRTVVSSTIRIFYSGTTEYAVRGKEQVLCPLLGNIQRLVDFSSPDTVAGFKLRRSALGCPTDE